MKSMIGHQCNPQSLDSQLLKGSLYSLCKDFLKRNLITECQPEWYQSPILLIGRPLNLLRHLGNHQLLWVALFMERLANLNK